MINRSNKTIYVLNFIYKEFMILIIKTITVFYFVFLTILIIEWKYYNVRWSDRSLNIPKLFVWNFSKYYSIYFTSSVKEKAVQNVPTSLIRSCPGRYEVFYSINYFLWWFCWEFLIEIWIHFMYSLSLSLLTHFLTFLVNK